MDMWHAYGIKLHGWDFRPTSLIVTATVIFIFCMIIQTSYNFTQA